MKTDWVYLSPHFDDAVLSCGGLIWEQTRAGDHVRIWTICAGKVPGGSLSPYAASLHARWGISRQSIEIRRQEDIAACSLLSAVHRHLAIPDGIYRREAADYSVTSDEKEAGELNRLKGEFLYGSEAAIFGTLHPSERSLITRLALELGESLPDEARVVCPLALGRHVDHQLVRAAAESLNRDLYYYADFPYVARKRGQLEHLIQEGWDAISLPVSPEGLEAWQASIAAHRSQISTFWADLEAMRSAVQGFLERSGGAILWRPPDGLSRA